MLCERAQELFSDLYEGSIQPALAVPLENHIQTCASCRDEYEGLKVVWPTLDSAPIVEPPADFHALVWQRIDAAEAERASVRKPLFRFDWQSLFPRPALGWAVGALAVLALARVIVPGPFIPAHLGDWRAPQQAMPAPAVGDPRVFDEAGVQTLKVHVQNPARSAIRVDVRIVSGTVDGARTRFTAPAGFSGWLVVGTVKPGDPAPTVNTTWHPAD